MTDSATTAAVLDEVDWSRYDFIDLGCSSGRSIGYCQRRFGAKRGIGVDLSPAKVEQARNAGVEAVLADATKLNATKQVRFVSMLDFLEHLPNTETVEAVLAAAAEAATDFIYIKHPSFEGEEVLTSLGLRQYWWHWHGHTAHIRTTDYCAMFDRLGLRQYMIRNIEPIYDSNHPTIIRNDLPIDQSAEEAAAQSDTPFHRFEQPVFRRQDIFIALRPVDAEVWADITKPMRRDVVGEPGEVAWAGCTPQNR